VQVLNFNFQDEEFAGNPVQDLLMLGFSDYMHELKSSVFDGYLLLRSMFGEPEDRDHLRREEAIAVRFLWRYLDVLFSPCVSTRSSSKVTTWFQRTMAESSK
jgi:hypothetical protein